MDSLPRDEVRLTLLADAARRRWPTALVIALLVGGAVVVAADRVPESYSSTAEVLLNPSPGNAMTAESSRSGEQINVAMQTEAGIVNSPPVADLVSATVRDRVEANDNRLDVVVPPNTHFIRLTYTGTDPRAAQRYAAAYAAALLQYRQNQSEATVSGQLKLLEQQSETAASGLKKAAKAASGESPSAQAMAELQLYTNRLANLQDQIGTLEATPTAPGALVTPANLPAARDGVPLPLAALVGLALGLLVGAAVAIWRERADDRIRARSEARVAQVPVLGVVPAGIAKGASGLVESDADGRLTDAYRGVRAATLATAGPRAVIAVEALDESLEPAALRVAVNLATSIARTQHDVCLVDATLGEGTIARLAGVRADRGLADALRDELAAPPTAQAPAGYTVVAGGRTPLTARELLASADFPRVVAGLSAAHDYVVIAAPAANLAEGSEVALTATGVVVVVGESRSERDAVRALHRRAEQLGILVLGLVAVDYQRGEREDRPAEPPRGGTTTVAARPVPPALEAPPLAKASGESVQPAAVEER